MMYRAFVTDGAQLMVTFPEPSTDQLQMRLEMSDPPLARISILGFVPQPWVEAFTVELVPVKVLLYSHPGGPGLPLVPGSPSGPLSPLNCVHVASS
jgi:hypothetical protein